MKKHIIVVGIILMLVSVGLCGCNEEKLQNGENNEIDSAYEKLIGTWKLTYDEEYMLTFYEDGKFEQGEHILGNWSLSNGKLIMDAIDNTTEDHPSEFTIIFDYYFSDNNQKLTITIITGQSMTYTKQ